MADRYTFGDTPTAAGRLALLAQVYEPATRDLLTRRVPPGPALAVDVGCGPGHTTRLLHTVTGATRTVGLDSSAAFLELARADPSAGAGVSYVEHDVTTPLPGPPDLPGPADLLFARFLVTHLSRPVAALRTWAEALRPDGGRLVLQEVARLVSRDPALGRYYELVAELQQRNGQNLEIGAELPALAERAGLMVQHHAIRELRPDVRSMAALHVLNLRTWRADDDLPPGFDDDELDALDSALTEIAHGRQSAEPIEQQLAELVLLRQWRGTTG